MGIFDSFGKTEQLVAHYTQSLDRAQQIARTSQEMCQEAIDGWRETRAKLDQSVKLIEKLLAEREAA